MRLIDELMNEMEEAEIREIVIGVFTTAVLSKRCGLSSTLSFLCHNHKENIKEPGNLIGKSNKQIASFVKSDFILEASLGMASINSGLIVNEKEFKNINAEKIIIEKGSGKTIAVIGHFPFVNRLRKVAKKVLVFETENNMQSGDLPSEKLPELLPQADVVAITGTSLINHTFEFIMSNTKKDAFKIMLGPSTPLSKIMFDYGIDVLCGTLADDVELLLKCIKQGANFRQIQGKKMAALSKYNE